MNEVLSTIELDFITFTSPSTVEAFKRLYTDEIPPNVIVVCIGNTTEKRAIELGFRNTVAPEVYTVEHMVEMMCNQIKERQ